MSYKLKNKDIPNAEEQYMTISELNIDDLEIGDVKIQIQAIHPENQENGMY